MSRTKKLTMEKMLSYCSEEDLDAINKGREESLQGALKGFEALDVDEDGYVFKTELIEMTKNCMDITDKDIEEFFETFDVRKDGSVSKEDWEKVFESMYDDEVTRGLEEAFLDVFQPNVKIED